MSLRRDEKGVIRRIIQLRLEDLAWTKIHEILKVDAETARSYFDENSGQLEILRLPKPQAKRTLIGNPYLSVFCVGYDRGIYLIKQVAAWELSGTIKTNQSRNAIEKTKRKNLFARCIQLYLEGFEEEELATILSLDLRTVKHILSDREFIRNAFSTKKPDQFERVSHTVLKNRLLSDTNSRGKSIFFHHFDKRRMNHRELYCRSSKCILNFLSNI